MIAVCFEGLFLHSIGGHATIDERKAGDRNSTRIVPVAGADHSMKVLASSPLTASDVAALVTASVAAFVNGVLG